MSLRGALFATKQSPIRRVGIASPSATQKLLSVIARRRSSAEAIPISRIGDCFRRTHRAFAMTGWAVFLSFRMAGRAMENSQ